MNRLTGLRAWLETNRVIIDALNVLVIGTFTVVVALFQCQQSALQTKLLEVQTAYTVQGGSPNFNVSLKRYQGVTGIEAFTHDNIEVTNNGATADAVEGDVCVVILAERYGTEPQYHELECSLYVTGYYNTITLDGQSEPQLFAFGQDNYLRYCNLETEVRQEIAQSGDFALLTLMQFVRLSYKDLQNNKHDDYFEESSFGTSRLNQESGRYIFDSLKSSAHETNFIELYESPTEKVIRCLSLSDSSQGIGSAVNP